MSYEIIYDKQFIKVKDKFLPFVLAGSNNCYENRGGTRDRRVRSWWCWSPDYSNGQMKPMTKTEMVNCCRRNLLNKIDDVGTWEDRENDYKDDVKKRYGYYTSLAINGSTRKTSYKSYENIYAIGCDNAITIEELHSNYGTLTIETGYYSKEELTKKGLEPLYIGIKNEDEFYKVYNKYSPIYGDLLRFTLYLGEHVPKRIRREKKLVKPSVIEETVLVRLDGCYTVLAPNGGYFQKNTKYGYRYSFNSPKKFATEQEVKKFCYGKDNCEISTLDGEHLLRVKKKIVEKLKNVLVVID